MEETAQAVQAAQQVGEIVTAHGGMRELLYLSVAILLGLSALGVAIGVALLGSKFLEGIARQPELLPILRTNFFIVIGLLDALPMIGVGISLYMLFTL